MTIRYFPIVAVVIALMSYVGSAPVFAAGAAYAGFASTPDCSDPLKGCPLSAAVAQAGQGGEVICVNPGQYGSGITITKSMTITCPGGSVQILNINAPGENVVVRGLEINAISCSGGCNLGIKITAANSVTLENVFASTARSNNSSPVILDTRAGPARLLIRNSVVTESNVPGIVIAPQSGTLTVALENVTAWNNTYGLAVGSGGRVMINRSTFSGNTIAGIEADGGAFIGIDNSLISSNETGVVTGGTIAISNTNINSNSTAISGVTQSYGNNRFFANSGLGTAPTPAGTASTDLGQR